MKTLSVAAGFEAASLLILFVNLFTVHAEVITSLGGPVHGMAYLVTIVMTFSLTSSGASAGARWRSLVPGVGGMLVLRQLRRHPQAFKQAADDATRARV